MIFENVFEAGNVIWASDLGKGIIGEDVKMGRQIPQKLYVLILQEGRKIKWGCSACAKAPYGSHRLTLRPAAWLFPTIDTARLVLIRLKINSIFKFNK